MDYAGEVRKLYELKQSIAQDRNTVDILPEFTAPTKLTELNDKCLKETHRTVHKGNHIYDTFDSDTLYEIIWGKQTLYCRHWWSILHKDT
jgi:hypothetical protein